MSIITVKNLNFAYDSSDVMIFDDVSFEIDTNWRLGFTGKNGIGKTTFMNILLGKLEYSGHIHSQERFSYFPFNVEDTSVFAIDVIREIADECEDWQIYKEIDMLDLSDDILYQTYDTLSNGEQTKIQLLGLFLKEHNFLLIDEPTNHLDLESRDVLANYLKSKDGYILVSHDRHFLDQCVDHILSINNTNIEIIQGNFSTWWENKQLQDAYEISQNERLKKDIKRINEAAKRTSNWSDKVEQSKNGTRSSGSKLDKGFVGHKAAKMMQRSKNLERRQNQMIQDKSELLKNVDTVEDLKIETLKFHSNTLLSLIDVSVYYDDKQVCSDINLSMQEGDRVALRGSNGSGKSSIVKLIMGEDLKYTGTLEKNQQLKISHVSQDSSEVKGTFDEYVFEHQIDKTQFFTLLRKLGFARSVFETQLDALSMGQKKKVMIARSLCQPAHLYIWDEPLNYIDILTRIQIEELILNFKPNLIFVEHDYEFTKHVATKIIEF